MRTFHNCQNPRTVILFTVARVNWYNRKVGLSSKSTRSTPSLGARHLCYR